jgi:hypothetical protein
VGEGFKDLARDDEPCDVVLVVTRPVVQDPDGVLSASFGFDDLRRGYGCMSVRFLRDHADRHVVLSVLEFPSLAQAFDYVQMWNHADGLSRAGIEDFRAEYYEELDRSQGSSQPSHSLYRRDA